MSVNIAPFCHSLQYTGPFFPLDFYLGLTKDAAALNESLEKYGFKNMAVMSKREVLC